MTLAKRRLNLKPQLIVALILGLLLATRFAPQVHTQQSRIYYVSAINGDDNNDGFLPETPFATIQHAADLTQPGDTVFVMNGTYTLDNNTNAVVHITRSGTEDAWITYQALPGHQPLIQNSGWWLTVWIQANYIIFDGFTVRGNNDDYSLDEATALFDDYVANGPNPDSHPRAFSLGIVSGAYNIIRNNAVFKFGGSGISADENSDYFIYENNLVYENGWYSPFGESGISVFEPVNIDGAFTGLEGTPYKIIIRNNVSHSNYNFFPCFCANYERVTDGNGIILDSFDNSDIPAQPYTAAVLVANNIAFNNGGSGIHAFRVQRADLLHNVVIHNGRHPDLSNEMAGTQSGPDVNIQNNIMVATPGENVTTPNGTAVPINFDYNIYYSEGEPPLLGAAVGSNDIIADPQLAWRNFDLTFFDWRPLNSSPAINSGTDAFLPLPDFWGVERFAGAVNRGAFESTAVRTRYPPIPKTPEPLTIDGQEEDFWLAQQHHTAMRMLVGQPVRPADLWAGYKTAWDENYLYLFVYVDDDVYQDDSAAFWDDDSVEIYLDIGNDKQTTYGSDDFIYWFRAGEMVFGEEIHDNTDGVEFALGEHPNGFMLEVAFPWQILGVDTAQAGQAVGLDMHVNDDDDGTGGDNKLAWFAYEDSAWQDPSLFGTAVLHTLNDHFIWLPIID